MTRRETASSAVLSSKEGDGSASAHLAKSAGIIGTATLTSRVLGLIRDQVLAYLFGAGNAKVWFRSEGASVKRYLSSDELEYFRHLEELVELKILVDTHFAHQNLNKKWLLLHVPLSVGLVIMALWHLLLVEVYAL